MTSRFPLLLPHFAILLFGLPILSVITANGVARADQVDTAVLSEMHKRHICGMSVAIIQDGKIARAVGYGHMVIGGATITPDTLFQAGSISKSVAAVAALHLVDAGKLTLDEDVNTKLTTWKIPDNDFIHQKAVTLREILSHTAGITVHGFVGYAADDTLPTLVQVLNGEMPANSAAIEVDTVPGSQYRYSGGGYTVLQQLMIDISGAPFPQFMKDTVLGTLGMTNSTYQQPLPADRAAATAAGYYVDRKPVTGRFHVYPEMAAAGLWTTASDLARFVIGLQHALAGSPNAVISQAIARQMVTEQKNNDGLGVFLDRRDEKTRFTHSGRNEGFDAYMIGYTDSGDGAVIMVDANDNSQMIGRIVEAIGRQYRWPGYAPYTAPREPGPDTDLGHGDQSAGTYDFGNGQVRTITFYAGCMYTMADGFQDEEFRPISPDHYASTDRNVRLTFLRGGRGTVTTAVWAEGGKTQNGTRMGP